MDRISELPKNLIECILERLPIQDAVRTSILSRRWRYNWSTLSKLVFDYDFILNVIKKKPLSEMEHSFQSIISKLLLLHSGPILKFVLCIPDEEFRSSPDISQWIYFLSKSGIKDFTLFNVHNELQMLPTSLFSFTELSHLNLFRCIFRPPPSFSGFCHLITIWLHYVKFDIVKFETFISACPLLEALTLFRCYGFQHLKIDCPTLKYLEIEDCQFLSVCLINTQNLTEVTVALMNSSLDDSDQNHTSNMINVFDSLPKVEKLLLTNCFIKFSAADGVPKRLPKSLNRLKSLTLSYLDFTNLNDISFAFCLIRSSPNLRKLTMRARSCVHHVDDVKEQLLNYLEEQHCIGCTLDHLCSVNISFVAGRPELEFIKFLLASAPSLETLIIELKQDNADAMLRVATELLRFRRASPKAEIICQY